MRKIKLELESLAVETFETSGAGAERRGTVLGAEIKPRPVSDGVYMCIETEITGPCCDITLALSCVQTNCDECMILLTADTCPE